MGKKIYLDLKKKSNKKLKNKTKKPSNECWCGNSYGSVGTAANCDKPCLGDATKICGGDKAYSVYSTSPQCII